MSRKTEAVVARTIGIDTGKNTLHLIGLDDKGAIVLREKLTRGRIAERLSNVPQCLIGIEAGMATHCVARELIALGHDVKQVPPVYARPFRQGHKNDFALDNFGDVPHRRQLAAHEIPDLEVVIDRETLGRVLNASG